jgi:hypothetical protein
VKTTRRLLTPAGLEALFLRQGFEPGTPSHITPRTLRQLARLCGRLRCPACGRRGLDWKSFRRGPAWRVLATCPAGHFAEEV